jgi:hypothetical protein
VPGAADPAALYLRRESVELAFVAALQRARKADVAALVELLAKDARFTMPPLPTWFQGQADIGRFLRRPEVPHAVAAGDRFRLAGINVLAVRTGRIAWIASCLDPDLHRRFGLPSELPRGDSRAER